MSQTISPPKRVSQIAIVVEDARATAKHYEELLNIGPWTFVELNPDTVSDMTVYGQPQPHAMLTAHAAVGDMDWEIIQPLDDVSLYAQHLREQGEGLHHVLFEVDDYDQTVAALKASGCEEATRGDWLGKGRYCYFDTRKKLATIIEYWDPCRPKNSTAIDLNLEQHIDPELLPLLKTVPPLFDGITPIQRLVEEHFSTQPDSVTGPYSDQVDAIEQYIVVDGHSLPLKVYLPKSRASNKPLPALLFIHGGGFFMGAVDTHEPLYESLAAKHQCMVR